MSTQKHTPEPWQTYGPNIEGGTTASFRTVARVILKGEVWSEEEQANAERIVACVNGCAGVADPSAVGDMLEALYALRYAFATGELAYTQKRQSDGDPYHPSNVKMCAAIARAEGME